MIIYSKRSDSGRLNDILIEEQKAGKISQLNDSNPTHFGLGIKKFGAYNPDPKGELPTRMALAEFLSKRKDRISPLFLPPSPERIYLLSSTSQGYSWLMKLLCDPQDKIAYPSPGYPLIPSIAKIEGVEAIPYFLRFDGSWYIDLPSVEEALSQPDVKALVLIHPNNPTGSYVSKEEFEKISGLCRKKDVAIICDEVFYDYGFSSNLPGRISGTAQALTFSLDGFSKLLASPQIKTAWIEVSGREDEVAEAEARLDFIADSFLPNSWFQNESTPRLLELAPKKTEEVRKRTQENLEALRKAFSGRDLASSLIEPEGGWSALVRFASTIDEDALVTELIKKYALSAQPGYFFDTPFNCVAVSLLPPEGLSKSRIKVLIDAIEALSRE
ncbi:MAG: pyridoxal phosphate-dependent aminotransferase [Aeriscardovia sp.]|nr:pyridoxal phosphate-dependent aminotransferase [Aeriscardovia sp.]